MYIYIYLYAYVLCIKQNRGVLLHESLPPTSLGRGLSASFVRSPPQASRCSWKAASRLLRCSGIRGHPSISKLDYDILFTIQYNIIQYNIVHTFTNGLMVSIRWYLRSLEV